MVKTGLITQTIKKIPLWVWLLILGSITFFTYNISISSDMGWYMDSALNIFLGKGFTDIDGSLVLERGPLFPLMIAVGYWLLGVSVWSAFWVVRIFAILNPVVIYFLGKRFFGKWIGFSAALLALSSYSLNYWSYRHLDAVWPFFTLIAIITIYLALEKKSYFYYVFSAIFMSAAYLVKQALILLFPLPFLLIILMADYRNKTNLKGVFLYAALIAVAISPWIYYVYAHTQNIKLALFGAGGIEAADTVLNPNLFSVVKNYFLGLFNYYNGGSQSLAANFSLAPLFVLSWIFIFFKVIRREKVSIILTLTFLLLSPYISYVGRNNLRLGQIIIFLLLTYLVTANFLVQACKCIVNLLHRNVKYTKWLSSQLCIITVIIVIVSIQTFAGDKPNINFLKESYFVKKIKEPDADRRIKGYWSSVLQEAGEWVSNNILPGTKLLSDKPSQGKPVYFYSRGNYPIYIMPVIQSNRLKGVKRMKGEVIFLSSQWGNLHPINKFFALGEDDLLSFISKENIDYIVIGPRRNFLTNYFEPNSGFKEMARFGKGKIKIYKVNEVNKLEGFTPLVAERARKYIGSLRKSESSRYEQLKETFFQDVLGLTEEQINGIESGDYGVTVKSYKIY